MCVTTTGVQFLDRSVLRLTDATERSSLLTPAVGNRLLHAAFVVDNVEVGEVTGVSVRSVDLLPSVGEQQTVDAAVLHPATGMRWEGTGSVRVAAPHATVDARVELLLTCETRLADTSITRIETEHLGDLADLAAVDARIVADDGALPADPALLATRRFAALKTLLHERFTQPDDFEVDGFFAAKGIDTVEDLLAYLAPPHHPERVELELVTDGTLPSRIVNHRVVAGVHIEEDPVARLHATIDEVQVARALLLASTETARTPTGMTDRTGLPFVLVFAEGALDDTDLPLPAGAPPPAGAAAQRAARLTELQRRLTPLGIALAPVVS
jgi:hypothetical protein